MSQVLTYEMYCQTSNLSHTLLGNKTAGHSDIAGESPVGAAPTTSSFSTYHLSWMGWAKANAKQEENHLSFGIWCIFY